MQPFTLKYHRPGAAAPLSAFFILSRGVHTGRPDYAPNVNCFVFTCAPQDLAGYYWLVYSLWYTHQFKEILKGTHMERMKKIITWAHEMGYMDRNVFASFKVRKKRYESKRLHEEQLRTLEQKILQRPMLDMVRDLFVFCCYTDMAPADLQRLQPHQISCGSDGITWLSYIRLKSAIPANIPLLSPAMAILKKHEWKRGDLLRATVFPVVTNKDLNANLKIIGEICELGISLNFYIARHTFATTVTLSQGVPITSIKEMMGHDRIETTMAYARVNNSMIGMDMMLVQEKIDIRQKKC